MSRFTVTYYLYEKDKIVEESSGVKGVD